MIAGPENREILWNGLDARGRVPRPERSRRPRLGLVRTVLTRRQSKLMDELVAIFLAEGFRDLTLERIAARLRCSKSTLYALGHSKEQVTVNVVKHFFRATAELVERRTAEATSPATRVAAYLNAVAEGLAPASVAFHADVAAHPGARNIYALHTEIAARRVKELIAEGTAAGTFRDVHAAFVGDVAISTMDRIERGEVAARTGLRDAEAYAELAAFVMSGIRST